MTMFTRETRAKIQAAASKLRYVPHSGARSLTRRKSDAIGVVLPDLFGEYFSELIRGIDRVAHAHGLQLLLSNMHGNPARSGQRRARDARAGRRLAGDEPRHAREQLFDALSPGLPAVLLNCHAPTPEICLGRDRQCWRGTNHDSPSRGSRLSAHRLRVRSSRTIAIRRSDRPAFGRPSPRPPASGNRSLCPATIARPAVPRQRVY